MTKREEEEIEKLKNLKSKHIAKIYEYGYKEHINRQTEEITRYIYTSSARM